MNILLTGASGFIGKHILDALHAAGHQVTLVGRRQGFDFNRMLTVADWLPHVQGMDVVINSVGIIAETPAQSFAVVHEQAPVALFAACAAAKVRRVIQISALGVDEEGFTAYQRSKKVADDALRRLGLDWFVLRPSLVYGAGGKSAALFARLAALPVIPVVGDGKQMIQPVHISDVVATVMQCLHAAPARRTLDVVAAYPLTLVEWLQQIRQAQGKRVAAVFPVPLPLVMAGAAVGRFVVPMLHPDNLRMLQAGNTAAVQPLATFLGRMPLSVQEAAR